MVLVTVAVEHSPRRRITGPADQGERRIDDHALLAAGDEQRTAVGVLSAARAAEKRDVCAERTGSGSVIA